MKLPKPNLIRYSKTQRIAIFLLLSMIITIEILGYIIINDNSETKSIKVPSEVLAFQSQIDNEAKSVINPSFTKIEKFNPNELNSQQWQELGFSSRQVQTIMKYKNSLGGRFSTKEEIRNCYVISPEKFSELEPYLYFSVDHSHQSGFVKTNHQNEPKIHYRKFNPNEYAQKDWESIGFSVRQAQSILNYKRSLGGNFRSLEEIEKSYVISPEKFKEMKPFMVLPLVRNLKEIPKGTDEPTPKMVKFNPNKLTREEWKEMGFSEKQVNTIFNYKNSLGGKFKDAETLKKCYSISAEKFEEIAPYLEF